MDGFSIKAEEEFRDTTRPLILQSNEDFSSATTIKGKQHVLADRLFALKEGECYGSASFFLRSIIADRCPEIRDLVTLDEAGNISTEFPDEEETAIYTDILFGMIMDAGATKEVKGKTVPLIQKAACEKIISGKTMSIERKVKFRLSMILGLNTEDMTRFMNRTSDSPIYNQHDINEMVCRFCHGRPEYRNYRSYVQLLSEMPDINEETEDMAGTEDGQDALIPSGTFDLRVQEIIAISDTQEARDAFIELMNSNVAFIRGKSQRARALYKEELENTETLIGMDLSTYPKVRESQRMPITINGLCEFWNEGCISFDPNDPDFEDIDTSIMQLSAYELDGLRPEKGRISHMLSGERSVTKKDILQLRLFKIAALVDFNRLDEAQHVRLVEDWRDSTQMLLNEAGLPPIYIGARFENLVLTALCLDPEKFLFNFYNYVDHKKRPK